MPWLTKHVVFINLYLSDEKEHISRRKSRSEERGYHESASKTQAIISQCRAEKNQLLHMQAIELQKMYKNIFSIDISDCTPTQAATRTVSYTHLGPFRREPVHKMSAPDCHDR